MLTIIRARQEYVLKWIHDVVGWPLVFVDKCTFNMHVVVCKGQVVQGAVARLTILPKQKNLTYIGAMSWSGIIFDRFIASHVAAKCGINTDNFCLFLMDLAPHIPESVVILLNNAPTHHTKAVEHTMDNLQCQGFTILYLLPYSPFLNLIEYGFSKIKALVCHATFHDREGLHQAITVLLVLMHLLQPAALSLCTSTDGDWCGWLVTSDW
jgi:hypothetical protein